MNTNMMIAIVVMTICVTITVTSFSPSHRAQEIKACMSQPNMQYVREWGNHYVCISEKMTQNE